MKVKKVTIHASAGHPDSSNRMKYLIFLFFLFIISASCEREKVEPIDIFATEDLTDPVNLDIAPESAKLMVNADRIIETKEGFHIKGTIFSEAVSGTIPVTSGDFLIKSGISASALSKGFTGSFNGYGTAALPSAGLFSAVEAGEIPGSEVWYNTGKIFKSESTIGLLPLLDDRYYFRHRLDKGKEFRMKKITLKLKEYYLDPGDPAALFAGDVYTEKAGTKRLLVEKGAVGISANELWEFVPYTYSAALEKVTGGTGFERMNGGLSFSGLIPVKKYPLKILGQGVINTSFSSNGPLDFFERGFDEASFRVGVNGKLYFTNELVKFLTGTDTVSLGKATLQAEFADDDFSIRLAGEYSDDILERLLGKTMMSFIPFNAMAGVMYLRGSQDPDDFLIYIEEKISLNIPGLGVTPLANSIFRVTKDEVGLSGTIALPYGIGNVKVSGIVRRDGTFILNGLTDCSVDIGSGLVYNASLEAEVTEKGVTFTGTMSLPYGIGDVDIAGGLTTDEIFFSGKLNSSIVFPVNASVGTDLMVSISSKTGVNLSGSLSLPGGIGSVAVSGSVNTSELRLTGTIGSGVSITFGNVTVSTNSSMSLTASSVSGVTMSGSVSLPFSLGNAAVSVKVVSSGLSMTGDLGSSIRISGYPLFSADMAVSASTASGMSLYGTMKFPGGFGWIYVSGYVNNSGFSLSGSVSGFSLDFGIISLSASFTVRVTSWSGVSFSGEGRGCVGVGDLKTCYSPGIDVDPDFSDGSVELCIDFVLGDACLDF